MCIAAEGPVTPTAAGQGTEPTYVIPEGTAEFFNRGVPLYDRIAVIGEDMNRVDAYVAEHGGETMFDLPTELPQAEKLAWNRAWINARMEEGYTIVDLGPSPTYTSYPYVTSPYYAMELAEIAGRGYTGWLPVWGVFD